MAGQKTFYEILEVESTASTEAIRSAFRRLARERHPDRFQGQTRLQAERDFQAITEAYNVLVDADRRSRYDQSLAQRGVETLLNPRDVARALLAKGMGMLKSGDDQRAGELFAQAVAHDNQNAMAHYLYGMFLSQHGRLEEALRQLDNAAKLDALNPKILLEASRLFAKARMFARATRYAEAASELSPGDSAVLSWMQQLRQLAKGEGAK